MRPSTGLLVVSVYNKVLHRLMVQLRMVLVNMIFDSSTINGQTLIFYFFFAFIWLSFGALLIDLFFFSILFSFLPSPSRNFWKGGAHVRLFALGQYYQVRWLPRQWSVTRPISELLNRKKSTHHHNTGPEREKRRDFSGSWGGHFGCWAPFHSLFHLALHERIKQLTAVSWPLIGDPFFLLLLGSFHSLASLSHGNVYENIITHKHRPAISEERERELDKRKDPLSHTLLRVDFFWRLSRLSITHLPTLGDSNRMLNNILQIM